MQINQLDRNGALSSSLWAIECTLSESPSVEVKDQLGFSGTKKLWRRKVPGAPCNPFCSGSGLTRA